MKIIISSFLILIGLSAPAEIPVVDASVLAQVLENARIALEQLEQLKSQVERVGNPAAVRPVGAIEAINSLGIVGVGRTLEDLRASADGVASLIYDGAGLYQAPGEFIQTSDGQQFSRNVEAYRKFDAITQATTALEDVMRDTEDRRQQLRQQIQATLDQLKTAATIAEVQKLHAVLTAQNSELAAVDRERDAATSRVLVQHIENQTDKERQEQARREERIVDFRSASEKLGVFLTPDTTPVRIPDSRKRLP